MPPIRSQGPASDDADSDCWVNAATPGVRDLQANPILTPEGLAFEWLLGDPAVLLLHSELHLWTNTVFHGILHYVKDKATWGFRYLETSVVGPGAVRPCVQYDEQSDSVVLFYEQYSLRGAYQCSTIVRREAAVPHGCGSDSGSKLRGKSRKCKCFSSSPLGTSKSHWSWSRDTVVLTPSLPWEKDGQRRVGNPGLHFDAASGLWRLYYSAGAIDLADAGIKEPKHFSYAEASDLRAPLAGWTKKGEPLQIGDAGSVLSSARGDSENSLQILGAGSLKVLPSLRSIASGPVSSSSRQATPAPLYALCNRLTCDPSIQNRTGSRISLLESKDGGQSFRVIKRDLIAPTFPAGGWKKAYVYGFDVVPLSGSNSGRERAWCEKDSELLVFYNARDEWKEGREAIGVSRIDMDVVLSSAKGEDNMLT